MQRLRYSRYLKSAVIILDIVIVAAVFVFFFLQRNKYDYLKAQSEENLLSLLLLSLFWILLSGRTKLYNIPRNLIYTLYVERIVTHIFIFLLGIILLARVSNNEFLKYERFWIAITLFTILFIVKSGIFFLLKYIRSLGANHRNVMFLSQNLSSNILKNTLSKRKDFGYKIFEQPSEKIELDELKKFWKEKGIHTIFLPSENTLEKKLEEKIFTEAENEKIRVVLIPNIIQEQFMKYELSYIESQPLLIPTKFPLEYYTNSVLKRSFDILFSVFFLVFIASWLFPIIAIIIKSTSKGNIFFTQKRYGYHDEVFECIKFRTMIENEESSTKTTTKNDYRITNFGKFLRKTSLDETPQFINVLLGNMSIVGPRPHMLLVDDYYKPKISRYSIRSLVKPGITGLAQTRGLRGDNGENMQIEMKKRVLADIFYVKNWSVILDFVIIFKTIFILIKGDKNAI
ncbi:undecaprenyl-phosphate glucose phosphotransferase [Cloacibacterium rupense]|uniref:Undecaprenyl-phosphate glucose phosphotransferase n=1 Tax=Cloacibacterium rupense TaxID=517423 RepID=A0ABQ2NP33_9FLAO|nr:exopolysaccharide biosynthesis polyprenyl glycosylphosphotransferase [Cloacibacterium rupense]GGP03974.1 undecaprenyl-phosphate glucose phosphotransferase [Cloacibacterium rupense]